MRCKVQHEPEIRLQKVLHVLRHWENRTTLSLFCNGKYARMFSNEFLTCDQHTAEDQEDELKHWLETNLHSEGKLSCDTELQSLMWLIYSTAPPPDTVTAGFSKLGISPSALSLLRLWCRERDTGSRDISPLEFLGNMWQPEGCGDQYYLTLNVHWCIAPSCYFSFFSHCFPQKLCHQGLWYYSVIILRLNMFSLLPWMIQESQVFLRAFVELCHNMNLLSVCWHCVNNTMWFLLIPCPCF